MLLQSNNLLKVGTKAASSRRKENVSIINPLRLRKGWLAVGNLLAAYSDPDRVLFNQKSAAAVCCGSSIS